jgi:hypothetical protein
VVVLPDPDVEPPLEPLPELLLPELLEPLPELPEEELELLPEVLPEVAPDVVDVPPPEPPPQAASSRDKAVTTGKRGWGGVFFMRRSLPQLLNLCLFLFMASDSPFRKCEVRFKACIGDFPLFCLARRERYATI